MLNTNASLTELEATDEFIQRHIGPDESQQHEMLNLLGVSSLDELITSTVPANILRAQPMDIAAPKTEAAALAQLRLLAQQNQVMETTLAKVTTQP